jgi:Ca-activated chloride channel family protein
MEKTPAESADKPADEKAAQASAEMTPLEKEQQQALQQWLRKIPDDPGQLLRNKFRYQYENNRNQNEHIDKDSEQLW